MMTNLPAILTQGWPKGTKGYEKQECIQDKKTVKAVPLLIIEHIDDQHQLELWDCVYKTSLTIVDHNIGGVD